MAAPADEMVVNAPAKTGLFANCFFVVIRSSSLSEQTALELIERLRSHDAEATLDTYDSDDVISLEGTTYIISATADFPEYHTACDAMIPTVKPAWIEHSLAKRKLQNPRQYSPDPRYFMSDVVGFCTELPQGDIDAIDGGILAMGGQYSGKLTSQVTHIITLNADSEMCQVAKRRQMAVKVVVPHWVDDCLKLGRKISEGPYTLPDAEICHTWKSTRPPYNQGLTPVHGATDAHPPSSPPPSPSATRKRQSVFQNKKVALSKDLGVGPRTREILEDIVRNSGGKVVNTASQCTIFVCKFRQGDEYKLAARSGKHVGSLGWLYHLITTDKWSSPFKRLLHYPIHPKGIPGMKDFVISVSNYTGEARTYLENLITACGAQCTKTLKQDNTHLISAFDKSEKCTAAKEWGVHLVNHLWLEESFAQWTVASVSNNRYTHFPSRTNLGEVVGQTQLDRGVLEKLFYPSANGNIDDKSSDTTKIAAALKRANSKNSKASDVRTPAASRFVALEKENITPSTTHSRKSKDAAAAKIMELTPDIQLYEKEKKRVGGVVYGGRRGKTNEEPVEAGRKRSADDMADGDALVEGDEKKKKTKKSKTGLPPVTMHLLVTGYSRWKDAPKVEDADRSALRQLGILVTSDAKRATHLAAHRIVRTVKFISAMAYAPAIISTNFIDACLESDELEDPDDFALVDKEQEKKLGLSLTLSRERAKENQGKLLEGRPIYCLPDVNTGYDTYNQIADANGGKCILYQGRKGVRVKSYRAGSERPSEDITEVYLLSPEEGQPKLWQQFRSMVEASRMTPRIVSADWLIESAMRQEILPVAKYELGS